MNKNLLKGLALFTIVAVTVPNLTLAATTIQYQPRTTQELIAFLYGRIVQLQEIQNLLSGGSSVPSSNQSLFDFVSVNTQSADTILATSAYLRGETLLFGKATAKVWFEYGRDRDFLDFKTRQVTVRTAYNRAIRTQVTKLEEDKRYYFRLVAEDNKGNLIYGDIYAFRTDESTR